MICAEARCYRVWFQIAHFHNDLINGVFFVSDDVDHTYTHIWDRQFEFKANLRPRFVQYHIDGWRVEPQRQILRQLRNNSTRRFRS